MNAAKLLNNRLVSSFFCEQIMLIYFSCLEAVRRNPPSNRASDAEMEQVASKWLRFAGDRSGGRQRRAVQAERRVQAQS